jgi:hypothetical protein
LQILQANLFAFHGCMYHWALQRPIVIITIFLFANPQKIRKSIVRQMEDPYGSIWAPKWITQRILGWKNPKNWDMVRIKKASRTIYSKFYENVLFHVKTFFCVFGAENPSCLCKR